MKIECPSCKASGNINEHDIPEEGMYLSCPRCSHGFKVDKPRAKRMNSPYATNTCSSCGYSTFCEEVFDICPKCSTDVRVAAEQKRTSQARNSMPAGGYVPPPPPPPVQAPIGGSKYMRSQPVDEKPKFTINLEGFANGFNPVAAVGWGAAVLAVIFIINGVSGLMDYHGTDIQAALSEKSVEPVSAWHVFWGYGFMPWAKTIYGVGVALITFGFLQKESWALKGMQGAVAASIGLVVAYFMGDYVLWVVRSVSPPWWGYIVEFLSSLMFMALLAVPFGFLLRYLKDRDFTRTYGTK